MAAWLLKQWTGLRKFFTLAALWMTLDQCHRGPQYLVATFANCKVRLMARPIGLNHRRGYVSVVADGGIASWTAVSATPAACATIPH